MERISNHQLFSLIVLFQIGTTIIFGFASTSGRAAWISVLISTAIGLLINLLYLTLMRMNPGLTLVEWYPAQFGKWIGVPISWMYALEFIYDGGRGIGDLKILLPSTILPKTPPLIDMLLLLIVIVYALLSGIETIGRLGEILLTIIFFLYFIEVVSIFSSGIINVQYIKPFLGKGWGSIWSSVWPLGITQTFGQSIEFAMIWPLVKDQKKIIKTTLIATTISGIFIASFDLLAVLVLGENTYTSSVFPLYRVVRLINVGDFIENLDAINVLYFSTTFFSKGCIHLYSAIRAIQQLTYTKTSRVFVIPVVLIALYIGMTMASSASEHLEAGLKIVPYNVYGPLFIVLPSILLIVTLIRNAFKRYQHV